MLELSLWIQIRASRSYFHVRLASEKIKSQSKLHHLIRLLICIVLKSIMCHLIQLVRKEKLSDRITGLILEQITGQPSVEDGTDLVKWVQDSNFYQIMRLEGSNRSW
ncbi:hypothetical protein NE237_017063 [Protea cynaroides]|uniref:Uncharacterized protein n=1 Tax=Protea cynaroides TaxID=273540 RepID=A0A9Q0K7B7_9MAGN|nr:hypothetical protein NE237_017063 [Protea cynaroides]